MEKKTKIIIAIASVVGIGVSVFLIVKARSKNKNKDSKSKNSQVDKTKNYVIGDSQTPLIDKNSQKVTTIGAEGEASLWKSGKGLKWLKDAVDAYQESKDVNSIVINIGTNGGFNPNDDIQGLVNSVRTKFPNAQLYVVKGSWGWDNNKGVTEQQVNSYYDKFKPLNVGVIPTAIGVTTNPHNNIPSYAQIGKELDSAIV
jgi:hypothetical protein